MLEAMAHFAVEPFAAYFALGTNPTSNDRPRLAQAYILRTADGRLVAQADVFIQNFRPGTADRLGAGATRLQALNERLVYCSISGFGASGPYVDRPSYDSVAQALSGFLSVVVDTAQPRFLGPALADAITGIYAAFGVLGALVQRGRTGRGRSLEVGFVPSAK